MRQLLTFAVLALAVMVFYGLYKLKFEGRDLENRSHQLARQIEADKAAIDVLTIEIEYLARPQRLQKLNARFLKLVPPTAAQIGSLDSLPAPPVDMEERVAAITSPAPRQGQ